jgi:hypothetical protein
MLLFAPVILFAPLRLQVLVAVVFAGMVLTFPMLRGAGLVPVDTIHGLAQSVNENRAGSLKYRFDHEDALLARANEKPLAGWGSWGRNRIYDPETGRDLSVTDGLWVIIIGQYGWIGYIAQFGLLTIPVIILAARHNAALTPALTGGAIMMAASLVYLIPNAGLSPLTWLITGALAGSAMQKSTESYVKSPFSTGQEKDWLVNLSTGALQRGSTHNDIHLGDHSRRSRQ